MLSWTGLHWVFNQIKEAEANSLTSPQPLHLGRGQSSFIKDYPCNYSGMIRWPQTTGSHVEFIITCNYG